MKREQSFLMNHPLIGGLILLLFLWLCITGVAQGAAKFFANPVGCPPGYVATGDRYENCEALGDTVPIPVGYNGPLPGGATIAPELPR